MGIRTWRTINCAQISRFSFCAEIGPPKFATEPTSTKCSRHITETGLNPKQCSTQSAVKAKNLILGSTIFCGEKLPKKRKKRSEEDGKKQEREVSGHQYLPYSRNRGRQRGE
jgi:hypothetical protein